MMASTVVTLDQEGRHAVHTWASIERPAFHGAKSCTMIDRGILELAREQHSQWAKKRNITSVDDSCQPSSVQSTMNLPYA